MESNNFYIRINYKAHGEHEYISDNSNKFSAHIVNNKSKSEKYLVGGGIYNKNGGTIVFKARDLKEAMDIADNNLLRKGRSRKYEETKRDLVILPKMI